MILVSSVSIPFLKILEEKARMEEIICARISIKGLAPIMIHSY